MAKYAPLIVRVGVSLVFLWFGLQQLTDPSSWLGWLPTYALSLPISPLNLVYLNGAFEAIFGLLLISGLYTRLAASLLALHMAHIISVVGYGEIGVRDFGIFMATVSVALRGKDNFSLDSFFLEKKQEGSQ